MQKPNPTIAVIVPVYLEAPNIEPLVQRAFNALRAARLPAEITFVDDDSPDDTASTVARLARDYPVRLERRTREKGLAQAVVHGFETAAADILVVMDGDLQHPPESLPDLINPIIQEQAEMVIGSRYLPGAHRSTHWPAHRSLASRLATATARILLPIHDPLSGFFAIHRRLYDRARPFKPRGFKIALELAVRSNTNRITEIPIRFDARSAGKSKLRPAVALAYLRSFPALLRIRHPRAAATALIAAALALLAAGIIIAARLASP